MSQLLKESLTFQIGPELVTAFAQFSGDFSSLHTDPDFGRRSVYGDNIVHGMLPLQFLAVLLSRSPKRNCRMVEIQGEFAKPIFIGDTVTLSIEENDGSYLYSVVRAGTQALITRGSFVLADEPHAETAIASQEPRPLLSERLVEKTYEFEEIQKGDSGQLCFDWQASQQQAFGQLLALAAPDLLIGATGSVVFLQLAMLSTLVGMCMPGRRATFQRFSLSSESNLSELSGPIQLDWMVSHKSAAANAITVRYGFEQSGTRLASGDLSVRVEKSRFVEPELCQLAQERATFGLESKVVLVTGASRGVGATTAKLFAVHGAKLVVNYLHSREQAESLVSEIESFGGQALAVQADVASEAEVARMVSECQHRFGRIDVLVNNAASNFSEMSFVETPWSKVQEDIDVMVKGAFLLMQAVLPIFVEQGGGKIVNVSTLATEVPPAMHAKYVIAKSALVGLTRAVAVEYAAQNVQVNLVTPSLIETDFTRGFSSVELARMKSTSPMKRLATPQDVADAIVFLASPRSAYTTGQQLMVTGGLAPFL